MAALPEVAITIIRRPDGAWFAHRRRANKRVYPGLYGLGAGGTLEPGETPAEGAARELREETGLACAPEPRFSFTFGETHRVHVFELVTDAEPGTDASEWDWAGWLAPNELHELEESGRLCPDTAAALLRLLAAPAEP